jgi:hypothetical protein
LHAPASAVLAFGPGENGVDSVAVWHVNSAGAPTGAWVRPQDEVLDDAGHARELLSLLEQRAITGSSLVMVGEWLERLSSVAGLDEPGTWWKDCLFSPVEALQETVVRRGVYEAAVTAERQKNKSIVPLGWRHALPDDVAVADFAGLRAQAGIAIPDGVAVISDALAVARVLAWLVGVWAETEAVKGRRSYVQAGYGAAEPLPPEWLHAVRAAAGSRLAA